MSRLAPVYDALEALGVLRLWRRTNPGDLILCYHNVIPEGARPQGDASLHLPLERFVAQLEWVMRHYDVVPLLDLVGGVQRGGRSRAAITFDDAYTGVLRHGLPALRVRGLPSTIFVTTEATARPRPFWWDTVAALRPELDRLALRDAHGGDGASILRAADLDQADPGLSEEYLPADWERLRRSIGQDVRLGAHTRTHPMLTHQPDARVLEELRGVLEHLEREVGQVDPVIAYPYGDVDIRVARLAGETGYAAGVTTVPSLVRRADPMQLPRLNVPAGMPVAAFRAEASGLRLRGASR